MIINQYWTNEKSLAKTHRSLYVVFLEVTQNVDLLYAESSFPALNSVCQAGWGFNRLDMFSAALPLKGSTFSKHLSA